MTEMKVSVRISADAKGVKPAATEAAAAVKSIGQAAADAGAQVSNGLGKAVDGTAATAPRLGRVANDNAKALAAMGQQSGLTRMQMLTLQYTINDVAASLASGISPFTILMQQGGQVTQAFGGLTGTLRALANPTAIGVASFAGLAAVLALGISRAEGSARALKSFDVDLRATGRQSEITAGQLMGLVDELKGLPGISKAAATAVVTALTGSRQIGGAMIVDLAKLTADFAIAMKQDAPEAAAALAKAFSDPAAGAKALEQQFGFLSAAQLRNIETMQRSGDIVGAQRALYEALNDRLKGLARDGMTDLQKGADTIGKAWGTMLDKLGQTGTIQAARDAVIGLLEGIGRAVTPKSAAERAQSRQSQISTLERDIGDFRQSGLNDRDPEIATRLPILQRLRQEAMQDSNDQLARMRRQEREGLGGYGLGGNGAATNAKLDPARTNALLDQYSPLSAQRLALQTDRDFLERARAEADPTSEAYKGLSDAIARVSAAYAALKTPAERAAEQTRLEAQVLKAPIAERDALRARLQAEAQARQAGEPPAEAARIGIEAERQARAQLADAVQQQLESMDRETNGLKAVAAAYAEGNPTKARAVEIDREAEELVRRLGISMDQAREKLKARADATLAAAAAQDLLNRKLDTEAMLTLGAAERGGNRNDIRAATIRNAGDDFARRFPGQPGREQAEADAATRYDEQVRNAAASTRLATDAAEARREALEKLNEQLASGILSEEQANLARGRIDNEYRQAQIDNLMASREFTDGAKAGFIDYMNTIGDEAHTGFNIVGNAFRSAEQNLVAFTMRTKSAKEAASDFFSTLISDLLRLYYQRQILGPLADGLGGWFSGLFSTQTSSGGVATYSSGSRVGGSLVAPLQHGGGIAGRDAAGYIQTPVSWFMGAPRYHGGGMAGLRPNEVPTVLLRDEEVLTRDDPRHRWNGGMAGNAAPAINVNLSVVNNSSAKVEATPQAQPRADGGVDLKVMLEDAVEDSARNGRLGQTLKNEYGAQRRMTNRG